MTPHLLLPPHDPTSPASCSPSVLLTQLAAGEYGGDTVGGHLVAGDVWVAITRGQQEQEEETQGRHGCVSAVSRVTSVYLFMKDPSPK